MVTSWGKQLHLNPAQAETKSREEDAACPRRVVSGRLANGEFKGMNIFSQESPAQECAFTPVQSFSEYQGEGKVSAEKMERNTGIWRSCVWVNLKHVLRRRKPDQINAYKHYSVTILLFFLLANVKSYCCAFFGWVFFPHGTSAKATSSVHLPRCVAAAWDAFQFPRSPSAAPAACEPSVSHPPAAVDVLGTLHACV